jgi:hypothetical protein
MVNDSLIEGLSPQDINESATIDIVPHLAILNIRVI